MTIRPPRHRRSDVRAFTLVEILVVIGILGVLMALVAPVVFSVLAQTRTRTKALNDIDRLTQALTAFHTKYNVYPPSSITLYENGAVGWNAGTQENRDRITRIWPKFVFTNTYDLNGDGDTDDEISLDGFECLVFFLAGVPDKGTGVGTGFAKDAANPFDPANTDRAARIFEFSGSRLADRDSDGFREFLDPFGDDKAYAYFSAYGGRGYVATDCQDGDETVSVTFDDLNSAATFSSVGPNPYTQGPPNPASGAAVYAKSDSFQVICAGKDNRYGRGGEIGPGLSQHDQDNLTNVRPSELRQGGG